MSEDRPEPAGHDTAGAPWSGRRLSSTGFDDDAGAADAGLLAALTRPEDEEPLVAAVRRARLLVPVVAVRSDGDHGGRPAAGLPTDMAAVTLTAPDGQRALPVFSSLTSLSRWDAAARPVPVTSARAAQAAVQERCDVMVLDLGAARPVTLRPSMVRALATERDWRPAHTDPRVHTALHEAVAQEPDVVSVRGEAGDPHGTLRVVLALRPGLGPEQVQDLVTRVGERIPADSGVRSRIDAVSFALRPA